MEESIENNQVNKVEIFSVPFLLGEINENQIIFTNIHSNYSNQEIINEAFYLQSRGKILEASKYYQLSLDNGIKDPTIFCNYAVILKQLGQREEAIKLYKKSIKLFSKYSDAYFNLGNILKDLGQLHESELLIRKAIELNPSYSDAHNILGIILKSLDKLEEAELSFRNAIVINPDFAEAYGNLGNILRDLGRLKEAKVSSWKAIEIDSNNAEAFFNFSLIELLLGEYESGLRNYEFRLKQSKSSFVHANPSIKKKDSLELNKDENILVISEQGLGDTLQFMRYIPYLRNQGLDISFCAQRKLHSLIKASAIDSNPLTPKEVNTVSEGQWIPLLSLPRYLKVNSKNPIITKPYIFSTDELIKKWKNILKEEKRPVIGINWQGNQNAEKGSQKGRSFALETFSCIARGINLKFLSLQKGFGSEQLEHCSFKKEFVKCQSEIDSTWDFLENAAIIANCDLVITSDTSIAHLAGGMGKPTWLLLKNIPEWRWGMNSDKSFWYPSMRLFRQKERHNWQEVMKRVSKELSKYVEF